MVIYALLGSSRVLSVSSTTTLAILAGTQLGIQPVEFMAIRRVRTMEFRWALAAFAGVLFFGTLKGIVIAVILSMISLSSQAANPRISVIGRKRGADVLRPLSPEHPDDETFEGLLMLIEGEKRSHTRPHQFWLAGLNPEPLSVVRHSGLADKLGRECLFFNSRAGIDHYVKNWLA